MNNTGYKFDNDIFYINKDNKIVSKTKLRKNRTIKFIENRYYVSSQLEQLDVEEKLISRFEDFASRGNIILIFEWTGSDELTIYIKPLTNIEQAAELIAHEIQYN